MKRNISSIFIFFVAMIMVLISMPIDSSANTSRGVISDGNATGSNYDPMQVSSDVKNAWLQNKIPKGGKDPVKYTEVNGKYLAYDVYDKGWGIKGDTFYFEGWSALIGYYHHDRYNQATYIGAIRYKDGKEAERKIFKAEMIPNTHAATKSEGANSDIYYNSGSKTRWCRDNEYRKEQETCNMEYKHVGFRAHIPLKELFPNHENREWRLYIIKNINGHLVYEQLKIPFNIEAQNWNHGVVSIESDLDNKKGHYLRALGGSTLKRLAPKTRNVDPRFSRYFIKGGIYKIDEMLLLNNGVTAWYGVIVPEDGNVKRWTTSAYLDVSGEITTISYKRTSFLVGVHHIDKNTNKVLLKEEPKLYKRGKHTFKAKEKGAFKTPEGYSYVPLEESKTIDVKRDQTITFYYKASIPNPSRIVEQGGGKNTHGHAIGQAEWKLAKEDKPVKLPEPNERDFDFREVAGGIEITNYKGKTKNVNVPETIQNKNVVSIADNAFANKGLTGLILPNTVQRIGKGAFKGNYITTIDIPDGVNIIQDEVFRDNEIEEVVIPHAVETIGKRAFYNNKIHTLELGESLVKIDELAFANNEISDFDSSNSPKLKYIENSAFLNNEIKSVSFNEGIIRIAENVFVNNAISGLNLPETLLEVGTRAFADNFIEQVIVNSEETEFGSEVFKGNQADPKELTIYSFIPSKAKNYADQNGHTFIDLYDDYEYVEVSGGVEIVAYNGNEEAIVLPSRLGGKQVVSIGAEAFYEKALTSVTLPNTIHTIKERAFAYNALTSIDLTNVRIIHDGAFRENELQNVTFGNNLEKIGAMSFANNKLKTISIPNKVTVIEAGAFERNELQTVTMANSVVEIGEKAFYGNKIKNLTLSNRLKIIGDSAFWNNELTNVELPTSLEEIGEKAFEANRLSEVRISKHNVTIGDLAFNANKDNPNEFIIYGQCDSAVHEYATKHNHTMLNLNGEPCIAYELATDDDFEFIEATGEGTYEVDGVNGYFIYAGGAKYVEIPQTIQGIKIKSYYRMFEHSDVKGVRSRNKDVTNMKQMFYASQSNELDLTELDTSNVTNMSEMFLESKATKLDLRSFDTRNVTNMRAMFQSSKAKTIIFGDLFDTSKVTDMVGMFNDSHVTKLDLSGFNTKNVTNMSFMFMNTRTDELDLSSFELNENVELKGMFQNAKAKVGYAGTEQEAERFNESENKPEHLVFVVKGDEVATDLKGIETKEVDIEANSFFKKVINFFIGGKVSADPTLKESQTHLINNFMVIGNHQGIRNVKHTIKVGNHVETNKNPFAIVMTPAQTKNKDMEYDFEYEYTNHIQLTYKCVDKKGSDCFAWALDKRQPAWSSPYVKKFKLSETNGSFERYTTSRVGRINNANVRVYSSLSDTTGKTAGSSLVGNTYYIKEKAIRGNEVRYLISTSPSRTSGVIGWVNELDMTTFTHYDMDTNKKTFRLTGAGMAYDVIWGGTKQERYNLRNHRGKAFNVEKTETVGDTIWYYGQISGTNTKVWISKNHTTSKEIIKINPVSETKINSVDNSNAKFTLRMNHKHNEDINVTKNTSNKIELLVGRLAVHDERGVEQEQFNETIEVDRKDEMIKSQTWKEIKNVFKYKSDYNNRFYVIDGDKYYYPHDLDENLRNKYKNTTKHNYNKYAIPLRVSNQKNNELEFKSADNFLLTKNTGFVFSVPHHEVSTLVIREEAKKQYEQFTGKPYNDTVIGDPFDASRYYFNIDLKGEQKPNTKYSDNVVIGKLGLNDVTVHLHKDVQFEHYLFGHVKDDPIYVEQRTSIIPSKRATYQKSVTLNDEQIVELKEYEKKRSNKETLHSFKNLDNKELIEKVKSVLGE